MFFPFSSEIKEIRKAVLSVLMAALGTDQYIFGFFINQICLLEKGSSCRVNSFRPLSPFTILYEFILELLCGKSKDVRLRPCWILRSHSCIGEKISMLH